MHFAIEITPEQHRTLQTLAEREGKELAQYLLDCALTRSPNEALAKEEAWIYNYLTPRLEAADRMELSDKTLSDILSDAVQDFHNGAL